MNNMIKTGKINVIRYTRITGIFLLIISLYACSRNVYEYSRLEIYIPAGINIEEKEIRGRLAALKHADDNGFTLRITVYSFSQGAEIINFSTGDQFSTGKGKAWIKALVQVKSGAEIVCADFIEVSGEGREDLLDRFGSMILEISGK
ncbi:MAG TPA: hypothetical protein PK514_01775 [Spirochaetota bacterium]|nr:hypothetical protein [Spirochaetota bacterium]